MDVRQISCGKNPPKELNVIIEVPKGVDPVKYEFDTASGALFVDRLLNTPMFYPCHYGFAPNTLSADGDPLDVLVYCEEPLVPGCVISVRPIGVLVMEDEAGQDEKILAVPTTKISPVYSGIQSYQDIPAIRLEQITHFFKHYKDLDKNKWVKVSGWESVEQAEKIITQAIASGKD